MTKEIPPEAASQHESAAPEPAAPPDSTERSPIARWLPLAVALAVPLLLFFVLPPLSTSGLWDPYELNIADLSRRIAINLYGAGMLALDKSDNSLPHLNDLGRPQLAFSSIALGFKVFGLHEWAGRLPLAVWGLLGVAATYAFVARLFDRRTGAYASIVLSTTPLYFVQARSMMGDICAMATLPMAFGGLVVAIFDRHSPAPGRPPSPTPLARRLPWLALAVLGLFAGFESRGGLLGLAVPLLGAGLSWATSRTTSPAPKPGARDSVGDAVGASAVVLGLTALAMVVRAAVAADTKNLDLWLGAIAHPPTKYPTFDYYVGAIAHSMAPWSAFLPFALGCLFLSPPRAADDATRERESLGRLAILVGTAAVFVAHAYLVASTDLIAFTGPALCAVACAVAIRDLERGASPSLAVGLGTLLLAAVIHHDFHELPEKAYLTFGLSITTFPEGFKTKALHLWWVVLGGFAATVFLTWTERDTRRRPFAPASYARVFRSLREAFDGGLALTYLAVVAGASAAALIAFLGLRFHWRWMPQMSSTVRDIVLNLWWTVAFVPVGAIFGVIFACDVWLWTFGDARPLSLGSVTRGFEPFERLFERIGNEIAPRSSGRAPSAGAGDEEGSLLDYRVSLAACAVLMLLAIPMAAYEVAGAAGARPLVGLLIAVPSGVTFFLVMGLLGDLLRHRAPFVALGGALVGFVMCFSYYPALANQLSPKEVFENYRRLCPGAPLGLLGVGGKTSAYYAGGQPQTLNDPAGAYQWLTAGGWQRRCLAMKADELPKMNQLWREHAEGPRTNLPVVDARSSQILLVASSLEPGEKNENPLGSIVLRDAPQPQHKLSVNMEDKLEVLGFDLVDDRGRFIDVVSPGRSYHFKTYYRVLGPITTEWEGFIHIDGYHRRHNGDHKPMEGKYPMSLWLPGDMLVDDHEFKLEPNFTPGTYT
ncbi:MAG: glycosyltransferase family 39 protein, partial [Polyangiaceae bacterium]|nr:glycosyltransferase family 39 protein [Polyangiaceae bacterium]